MSLWGTLKITLFGRDTASRELSAWKRAALRENGAYSSLSGKRGNLEVHHGFHFSRYPVFALSRWNDWVMTDQEHRLHRNSYHSWERRWFKGPLSRLIVAETPIGLLLWAYFAWHWWKGWSFVLVAGALFLQYH